MSTRRLTIIHGLSHSRPRHNDLLHTIRRVRAIVQTITADCDCREQLDQALQHFEELEKRRHNKLLFEQARCERRRIISILELLRDIDDSGFRAAEEPDVLIEASLLFDDIATAAEAAGRALRRISPQGGDLNGKGG